MLDTTRHPIRVQSPHYAETAGAQLHRFLNTDFVPQFRQDVERNAGARSAADTWQSDVAFSSFDDRPVLALPIHHTYHMVSCAVTCDRLGQPALDPRRITSAGFVIRRIAGEGEQAWMLEDGKPTGWQLANGEDRDPDLSRRRCLNGVLRRGPAATAYSGEETHPLHVLDVKDESGKRHTVLHGFLPLGGFYHESGQALDETSENDVLGFSSSSLPYPFGFRGVRNVPEVWSLDNGRPVNQGRPTMAFYELLQVLVNRYHLGERGIEANAALEDWASNVHFYSDQNGRWRAGSPPFSDLTRSLYRPDRKFSLLAYLQACFDLAAANPIVPWLITTGDDIDAAGGPDSAGSLRRLPQKPSPGVSENSESHSLYISSADAQELRDLLGERLLESARKNAREIPIPKYRQRRDDIYQIVPFVRAKDEAGKEHVTWASDAERSMTFRVAAPFDPDVSRPSMIQMPGLADLKRGLAKGASMITPADTFNIIRGMKMKKGASEDVLPESTPSDGLGIQWICSFSLPVITLVAMILLMIMISLLNMVFFWLPWVRICLPFPKIK